MLMELLRASSTWLSLVSGQPISDEYYGHVTSSRALIGYLVRASIHSGQCLIFPNVYICGDIRYCKINYYGEGKCRSWIQLCTI